MPVFDVPAKTWRYDADLSNGVSAAAFRAGYASRKGDGTFDPQFFQGIKVFRGEANPDLVRIKPMVEGLEETLCLGVVDENGAAAGGRQAVDGELVGRDLVALALDRYPAAAFTLQGLQVLPGGTLGYTETFQSAARRLAAEAGLSVLFDCRDYQLGKTLPVTTDRTVGEYLEDLLRPLRFAEKRRTDVWIEGTVLRVAERLKRARGTVRVNAERLRLKGLKKTALPAVDGVRVEGASYQAEAADVPTGAQVPGLPSPGLPYTNSFGPFTVTKTVGGKTTIYTDEGTEWYDAKGRMLRSFRKVVYLLVASRPTSRVESWEKTCTFYQDSTAPFDGAPKTETETYRVLDVWTSSGGGVQAGTEVVKDKETEFRYFSDTGDPLAEDSFEVERDESGKTLPLPVRTNRSIRYRYRRSAGRVIRDWEVSEADDSGVVNRSFGSTEVGAFHADAGRLPTAPKAGNRMETRRISAGPEATSGRFRVEQSELLGAAADCEAIRQDLIEEHGQVRIGATFTMEPDLRVKVGKVMEVLGAPAWWPATSFTVTAVAMEADGRGLTMRADGVAWIPAP